MYTKICLIFLCFLMAGSSADTKAKEVHMRGLQGLGYYPRLPYGMFGFKPSLSYGKRLSPGLGFLKPEESKAPFVPPYGDMEKMVGYGGLMMPYGGYGYPMLQGYGYQ